jgi:hypothetical protein
VLTASALGLPINGSPGAPALAERAVRVDIGRVYHTHVLEAGSLQAAAALQDHFETAAEAAGSAHNFPFRAERHPCPAASADVSCVRRAEPRIASDPVVAPRH